MRLVEHVGHGQFDGIAGVEAGLLLRDEGGDQAVLGCDSIDIFSVPVSGPSHVWTCSGTEIGKKAWLFAKLQPGRARKRINAT